MKNLFIFVSVFTIATIAFFDAIDIFSKSDNVASSKTPAQMEKLSPLNRKDIQSHSLNFDQDNQNNQNMHDKMRKQNEQKRQKIQENMNKRNNFKN